MDFVTFTEKILDGKVYFCAVLWLVLTRTLLKFVLFVKINDYETLKICLYFIREYNQTYHLYPSDLEICKASQLRKPLLQWNTRLQSSLDGFSKL